MISVMDRNERVRRAAQIGDRIRLGDMSITELAAESGVDVRTIQTYADASVQRPQASVVLKLMKALGISEDEPLATEAEALDVIRGLIDSLPASQHPALIARLVEVSVHFITSAQTRAEIERLRVLREKTRRLSESVLKLSPADVSMMTAALDTDEGDELAGESEHRAL